MKVQQGFGEFFISIISENIYSVNFTHIYIYIYIFVFWEILISIASDNIHIFCTVYMTGIFFFGFWEILISIASDNIYIFCA